VELDFHPDEHRYLVDTSGLLRLEVNFKYDDPVFKAVWEEIEAMIGSGLFKTIDFVEMEINTYEGKEEFLKSWTKRWRKHFVMETDPASVNAAIPIINEEYNSGFFDAKKLAQGIDEADPYLIAFCKVHGFTLITNESKQKPNKIPKVAEKNQVRCIDINEFLAERGMRMIRRSSDSPK
jgi:hypothetical protein